MVLEVGPSRLSMWVSEGLRGQDEENMQSTWETFTTEKAAIAVDMLREWEYGS